MRRYFLLLILLLLCFSVESCRPKHRPQSETVIPNDPAINAQLGKLFLAKNRAKIGVSTFPSGLQYSILKEGVGDPPKLSDLVTVYYQGQYIQGKIFDSEHALKNPVTIRVSAVIPGWQEALLHMQTGSKWVLYIPPNLAYGDKGIPGLVGPNMTLIYYVHLLRITKGS